MSVGLVVAIGVSLLLALVVFVVVIVVLRLITRRSSSPAQGQAAQQQTAHRHPVEVAREFDTTIEQLEPLFLAQLKQALAHDKLREQIYVEVDVQKSRDRKAFEAAQRFYANAQPPTA